jgi:hypothetical protein
MAYAGLTKEETRVIQALINAASEVYSVPVISVWYSKNWNVCEARRAIIYALISRRVLRFPVKKTANAMGFHHATFLYHKDKQADQLEIYEDVRDRFKLLMGHPLVKKSIEDYNNASRIQYQGASQEASVSAGWGQ